MKIKLPLAGFCLVLLFSEMSQVLAANVVLNPGFETGNTSSWSTWGSTIAASTEQKRSGSYSCLNTSRSAEWQGSVQDLNGQLTLGVTYRITAWLRLRNTTGIRGQLTIQRTDSSGVTYYGSDSPVLSDSAWTPVALYYTHGGSGVTGLNLYITTPGAVVEFFVDDVAAEQWAYDPQALTIDVSATGATVSQLASGYLFGVSGSKPDSDRFETLKPRLVRFDAALGNPNFRGADTGFASSSFMNRIKATGSKMQVIVSDEYQWVNGYHTSWGWPGDPASGGYTSYQLLDQVINDLMDEAAASFPASGGWQIEWDIWNEPDYPVFWGRTQAQFFQTWKHAVQTIRSRDANAVIVGPSAAAFDSATGGQYLKDFLIFARDNNVLPNVLSWHALDNPKNVAPSVRAIRAFMAANSIADRPIDINEYSGEIEFANSARHVRYIADLERAGVRRAAHAVWDEISGNYSTNGLQPGHLCHLLTQDPSHSPRALWHLYRAYADLEGTQLGLVPGVTIDGLAAKDSSGSIRMIFGNDAGEADEADLTIKRLDLLPFYAASGTVRVIVTSIPNTGTAALAIPNVISNTSLPLTGNSLTIPLSFAANEVLLVKIEDSGAQAASPGTYSITQGTFASGNAASVVADDNNYLAVNSQTSGSTRFATTEFTVSGLTPSSLSRIDLLVVGKSSKSATAQTVSLWNYATSTWNQVDTVTIGTGETTRNFSVTTNASNYLSSGNLRVRVSASKSNSSFKLSLDRIRVVVAPAEPIVVDNFSFENPVAGWGSQYDNWSTATWANYNYTAPALTPTKGQTIAFTNTAGGLMYQIIDSYTLQVGDKIRVRVDNGWPSPNPWAGLTVGFYSVDGPNGPVAMPTFVATQPLANAWNSLTMDFTVTSPQAGGHLQMAIYGNSGIQAVVDNVRVEVSR